MTKLLTRKEAADILRITTRTLDEDIKRGTIPHTKIGRKVRIPEDALERVIKNNTFTGEQFGRTK